MYRYFSKPFMLILVGIFATCVNAQDPPTETSDGTAEIEVAIQSYAEAFNAKNVAKLVSHWSPEGIYISRTSGDQVVGHDALSREFSAIFAGDNIPTLAVSTESIDFVSPNVAVENGNATITFGEDDVSETRYSVVYVKRDGAWLIDRVSEEEIVVEVSNFEKLQVLEWLIGDWQIQEDGMSMDMTFKWTRNQNYISRTYEVNGDDGVQSSGLQVIGWDPVNNQICSWLFDSDGGFVKGTWTERDGHWHIQSTATLADGVKGSFTAVIRPSEDGDFTWKKINQVVDGELLPNLDEITIRRK